MANGRAKRSEIWDSETSVLENYMGYIGLCNIQGHFWIIWCTCDFPKIGFLHRCCPKFIILSLL